ncbi:MAG TPA: FtsW/RodA/SpoVE family cell cycle protein [Anaerolineales bacterium]|nr:FtsW/RodA/SpoVE family cell cycle protein [Anaerolineales bacterium]
MSYFATSETIPQKKSLKLSSLNVDIWLLAAVILLVLIGLYAVFTTTWDYSLVTSNTVSAIFLRQFRNLLVGLVFMGIAALVPYPIYKRPEIAIGLLIFAFALVIFTIFFGTTTFGAKRAIFGGSVQPSEIAKLATIIYLAVWLSSKKDVLNHLFYGLFPYGILLGIATGLVAWQSDMSAAATIAVVGGGMFLLAGASAVQLAVVAGLGGAASFVIYLLVERVQIRVNDFWIATNNFLHAQDQVRHGLAAIISGGWFGKGPGAGIAKFALENGYTDSIFAVIGEELGVFGMFIVLGLFVLLVSRGVRIGFHAPDTMGTYLAIGLASWIGFEAMFNILAVLNLIPFVGNALPFISYGGSALVISLTAVGILLSISRGEANALPERRTRASVDISRGNRRTRLSSSRTD